MDQCNPTVATCSGDVFLKDGLEGQVRADFPGEILKFLSFVCLTGFWQSCPGCLGEWFCHQDAGCLCCCIERPSNWATEWTNFGASIEPIKILCLAVETLVSERSCCVFLSKYMANPRM